MEVMTLWLKVIGALCSGVGALVLAWRVKTLLGEVVLCLFTHDESIRQIRLILERKPQSGPIIEGYATEVALIQDKIGLKLLICGFVLMGVGMLCNAASYILAM